MATTNSADEAKFDMINLKIQTLSSFGHFLAEASNIDNGTSINALQSAKDEHGNILKDEAGQPVITPSFPHRIRPEIYEVVALGKLIVRYANEIVAVALNTTSSGLRIVVCATGGESDKFPGKVVPLTLEAVNEAIRSSNMMMTRYIYGIGVDEMSEKLSNAPEPATQAPNEPRVPFEDHAAAVVNLSLNMITRWRNHVGIQFRPRYLLAQYETSMALPAIIQRYRAQIAIFDEFENLRPHIVALTDPDLDGVGIVHNDALERAITDLFREWLPRINHTCTDIAEPCIGMDDSKPNWKANIAKAMYALWLSEIVTTRNAIAHITEVLAKRTAYYNSEMLQWNASNPFDREVLLAIRLLTDRLLWIDKVRHPLSPLVLPFFTICGRLMCRNPARFQATLMAASRKPKVDITTTRISMYYLGVNQLDQEREAGRVIFEAFADIAA